MDSVTAAQYLILKDSFARKGVNIDATYTPAGDIDYIYVVDRLLARGENVEQLLGVMPGLRRAEAAEQPGVDGLVRLTTDQFSLDQAEAGALTVPELLDVMDERFENSPRAGREEPLLTPVHIVYITKITPAGEPDVPGGATGPWPPPNPAGGGNGVKIGISDTGLQPNLSQYSWMTNVTGDPERPGRTLPNGQQRIRPYAGHGTFAAGAAKCTAPNAAVYVNDHFTESEGEAEDVIIRKLDELITAQSPDLVCLPAGLYARNNWPSLPFNQLHQMHPDLTLVASAGNDHTDKAFYPAAYPWAIGVGALATDQVNRAWFSNYGNWVDIFALGEGLINAYAHGEYVYHEKPKAPAKEIFSGLARWSGTSFSAPLVAGLIASQIPHSGSAAAAAQVVLQRAQQQAIPGVGPALVV